MQCRRLVNIFEMVPSVTERLEQKNRSGLLRLSQARLDAP